MFKRLLVSGLLLCAVAASVVVLPLPAAAQDHSYFTYVSWWTVPREQWAAFDKQSQEADAQMKSALADGTIVAWGDVATRVHEGTRLHSRRVLYGHEPRQAAEGTRGAVGWRHKRRFRLSHQASRRASRDARPRRRDLFRGHRVRAGDFLAGQAPGGNRRSRGT